MKIPLFSANEECIQTIATIESLYADLKNRPYQKEYSAAFFERGTLKSSLFSANIEGNPLTLHSYDPSSTLRSHIEVHNIIRAIEWIHEKISHGHIMSLGDLHNLHSIIMDKIELHHGKLRTKPSAIFNASGFVVYVPPPPSALSQDIHVMLTHIHTLDTHPLIVASLAHLIFEKIHPYPDGNGRVGRLLFHVVLKSRSKSTHFSWIPFEEQLATKREDYYYHLDRGLTHTEDYVNFMLTCYKDQMILLDAYTKQAALNPLSLLSHRQGELASLIQEHTIMSFDQLKRRFLKVPERTLRYNLKQLQKKHIIEKIGTTKGVCYKMDPDFLL